MAKTSQAFRPTKCEVGSENFETETTESIPSDSPSFSLPHSHFSLDRPRHLRSQRLRIMMATIPFDAVSDHFVDANKMIQAGAGPFSRRRANGHFDDSYSIEFDGIRITPTFATSRPSDHFVGSNKMVGTASREPLEFERFESAPQPERRALHPMRRSWALRRSCPQPQRGVPIQPRATPWVSGPSPFSSPEGAA